MRVVQKPFKSRLKVNWQLWEEAIPAHTPQLTSAIGIWINPQKGGSEPWEVCRDGSFPRCPFGSRTICPFRIRKCADRFQQHQKKRGTNFFTSRSEPRRQCTVGMPHCPWFTKNRNNPWNPTEEKFNRGPNRPQNKNQAWSARDLIRPRNPTENTNPGKIHWAKFQEGQIGLKRSIRLDKKNYQHQGEKEVKNPSKGNMKKTRTPQRKEISF